ncbi:UxaA family hydrolase [Parapedobacter soli]|uniref:UxaA family hydrolase n=1 Tax=Parapedobacter soli TaxID=416955 RepID=UPI0021C7C509|nr:UxaA family hydrolase [Parapedobacter soli]
MAKTIYAIMEKLMHLHPLDSVAIVREPIEQLDVIVIDGHPVTFAHALGFGHKIAIRPIAKGEQIIKFGVPIGSATADIRVGEHVHLHNIESNYLVTYTHTHEFTEK